MAILILTESLEETIQTLEWKKGVLEDVPDKQDQFKDVCSKLETALRYQEFYEKKSYYEKILHLKVKNVKAYIRECKQICAQMKGVDFVPKKLEFRVRISRGGKRVQLGMFETFDDALSILRMYVD
jgi:hypothetical protein